MARELQAHFDAEEADVEAMAAAAASVRAQTQRRRRRQRQRSVSAGNEHHIGDDDDDDDHDEDGSDDVIRNLRELILAQEAMQLESRTVSDMFDSDAGHAALLALQQRMGAGMRTRYASHQPASQWQIDTMPAHRVDDTDSHSLRQECQICRARFRCGDWLRTLPCMHMFHRDCSDNWLQINAVCPVCQHPCIDNGGHA
jgi:hypothetical protein